MIKSCIKKIFLPEMMFNKAKFSVSKPAVQFSATVSGRRGMGASYNRFRQVLRASHMIHYFTIGWGSVAVESASSLMSRLEHSPLWGVRMAEEKTPPPGSDVQSLSQAVAALLPSAVLSVVSVCLASCPWQAELTNTTIWRGLTLLNRSIKPCFNSSDYCLTTSQVPVCKMRDFAVGCSATMMSGILSEMSDTVSLLKWSISVFFLLPKAF